MLVFASSDKGGTGRSVTSCNIAFHLAQRLDVAYLDFDFGSPTSGAIFEIPRAERGVEREGLHTYFTDGITDPRRLDVWRQTTRQDLRGSNVRAGRLAFFPGDKGGAEFGTTREIQQRCVELFTRLDSEFDVVVVDLSAGRSAALTMALMATAQPSMRGVTARWLVFHRWTHQHIVAANGLVYGDRGLLAVGKSAGHDQDTLLDAIRFVRVAVPNLREHNPGQTAAQATWLHACDEELRKLAVDNRLGRSRILGTTPVEPVLQWREQIIAESDVSAKIANAGTVKSFRELSVRLTDDAVWEGM
ncbi:SCO2523 family variant P-loop protein [Umezawaea tangerina]|uniref:CobQ/CobB/MinD/ParA family nucleotide binding protein n=1 Tax=Umezawaea tangerina TaxID=84725 RepID=A0A2T0SWM4_9PSEU|nr:SCO2523 family variant P-loop protein [Umezawaea tangerina]PRY37821.1 CobQ/CobB/MinD/ParA family nucleotide binding protein [Umezawaea tangerina]